MANSKSYKIVHWIHEQGERGATLAEVAAHFSMDINHVYGLMGAVSRRCYCSVEFDESVSPRRYVVRWLDNKPKRNGFARPVRGTHRKGMIIEYRSAAEAELEGGFCARGIRYVLSGRQRTHAGYKWAYVETGESKS